MFKILFFCLVILYIVYKVSGFLTRIVKPGSEEQRMPKGGNVHVDSNPTADKQSYKGGEYVDYEEVK